MMGQCRDWRRVSGWRPRWRSAFHGRAPARFARHGTRRLQRCTVAQSRIYDCFYLYRLTRMWWLTYTRLEMVLSAAGKNYAPTRDPTSGPRGVFSIIHSWCLSSMRILLGLPLHRFPQLAHFRGRLAQAPSLRIVVNTPPHAHGHVRKVAVLLHSCAASILGLSPC